jgi:RNA polymerase sigma factor (sigma-70 family)
VPERDDARQRANAFIEEHRDDFLFYARRMRASLRPDDTPADLAQRACLKVWKYLLKGNLVRSPAGLIVTTLRSERGGGPPPAAALPENFDPPDGSARDPTTKIAFRRALSKLDEPMKSVAMLFLLEGMTHSEIAKTLGFTVRTSKRHWADAPVVLKGLLFPGA